MAPDKLRSPLMSDKQVVLAIFADEAAADAAVEALKVWGKASNEKLDAIGVLVLDADGKVKDQKLGKRTLGKGAGIGLVLAMATPVGLAAGVVAGGVMGAAHKKGLGLTDDNREQLGLALADGKAAVGVLVDQHEVEVLYAELTELGGTVQLLAVSEAALAEAAMVYPSEAGGDEAVIAPARGG
jgi:uncharacterized membrane protein